MTVRYPLEHKFRIGTLLKRRWKDTIPPRRGDALLRAFMNKLVEEAAQGEEELLYALEAGNFSLLRGARIRPKGSSLRDRSPRTGRFLPNPDEEVPYDAHLNKP